MLRFDKKGDFLKERECQIRETEELLAAGRKLSSVLESLPVGVLITDINGRICQTNGEVSRICKEIPVEIGDVYGETLKWWETGGHSLRVENGPLSRALTKREISHKEVIEINCVDGCPKRIHCSASPLFGHENQLMGAVIVIQDVTETKKIEEDLEERINKYISLGVELGHSPSAHS